MLKIIIYNDLDCIIYNDLDCIIYNTDDHTSAKNHEFHRKKTLSCEDALFVRQLSAAISCFHGIPAFLNGIHAFPHYDRCI